MNANDVENYMAIGEQDNETHAEMKLREAKEIADDAHKRELVYSILEGDDMSEEILGRTRKEWGAFLDDYFVQDENKFNLVNPSLSPATKMFILNTIQELTINAILRELGVE